jgi:DNA-binding SARP family transcriptional activator/tetratricopeptide (TPR) repeat protein
MPGPAPVLVHLVGPLRVERGREELTGAAVASRKGRTLLRLLCARRGDVLGAAEVADVLWADRPPADPDAVVASLVSRLRRVLGPAALSGGQGGYRAVDVDTDLDRARDLLADAVRQPPALAATAARAAARLLEAGEVLAGEPDAEWVAVVRADANALRRRARHVLAGAALADDDPQGAEDAARRALADDPLDEEAARLLMRALLDRSLPAAALRVYEDLRRVLADELGTDPAPATRRLHAAALAGARPADTAPREPVPADHLRLSGRDAELGRLRTAWADACRGRGSLVVVAGEPGIGKSRLLDELATLARTSGGVVLRGRAFEGERSVFAQPVVDALAGVVGVLPAAAVRRAAAGDPVLGRVVPQLAALADPPPPGPAAAGVEPAQSFRAVGALLCALAREQPVLVVVDDLQRAGRSTLELLHFLARDLAGSAVLLAAAARSSEGSDTLEVLGDVAVVLPLGPLPAEAVAELAARAGQPGRAGEVARRTGGLPLFVVEVLRALAQGRPGLPPSLRTAVVDRVARTGPDTERLLRAAAVLGSVFDPLVAASLSGTAAPSALQRFERALADGLLVPSGPLYEFAHDVVREVLYETTPSPTRLALHAGAADLLSAHPEVVAAHAEAVGDRPRAARAWLRAAERALARFVASDAIALATRAAAAAGAVADDEVLGRALVARGRANEASARFGVALDDLRAAGAAARRAGDRRLEMVVLRELAGDVPVALGHPPADGEPLLRGCLDLAESLGDRAMAADVLGRLTVLRCSALDFVEARSLARRALRAGTVADDPRALARGLDAAKTAAAYLGLARDLAPVLAELEPLLRRLGDLWTLQWAVFEGAVVPLAAGDDAGAIARIDAAVEICRRSGFTPYEPFFVAHRGWVHRLAGRLDDALRDGTRAVALAAEHRHSWWATAAAALHAGTLLRVGNPAAAADVLAPAARAADVPGAEAYLLRCLAPLAEATGDPAVLERADALLRGVRVPQGCAWLLGADVYGALARAWQDAGRPERAEAITTALRGAAVAAGWPALADAVLP